MTDPGSFEEYERQQEMLARAVKDNLRQLEQMANHFEKEGNTAKAKELRDLLEKLRNNLRKKEGLENTESKPAWLERWQSLKPNIGQIVLWFLGVVLAICAFEWTLITFCKPSG